MALSDAFIALLAAQIGVYYILYENRIRWKRIMGAAGIILIGFAYVYIADSIPMMILMMMSLIIGATKMFEEMTAIVAK